MIAGANSEGYRELVKGVWLKNLVHGEFTHMTQVRMDKGALIPEHSHMHEQTGFLVSGCLRFFGGETENIVRAGDSWSFHGGFKHGAEALEDAVVIEVFSPLREDYLSFGS